MVFSTNRSAEVIADRKAMRFARRLLSAKIHCPNSPDL